MFFTEEDYRKIEKWLVSKGIMDTQFSPATTLDGNETIAIVQNGKNVNTTIDALVEKLFLLGVDDFLNVTDKYEQPAIPLIQAISLIPFRHRKIGQVITFLNEDNKWVIYQFQGSALIQWNNTTQWVNVIGSAITGELVPDEEDLTGIKEGDKTVLKFKNKPYNAANFSGLGRVYLRKNIAGGRNILTQQMINQENTRYILQYDYDLNGQTITIPANCTLDFQGGSFINGTVIGDSTKTNLLLSVFDGDFIFGNEYHNYSTDIDHPVIIENMKCIFHNHFILNSYLSFKNCDVEGIDTSIDVTGLYDRDEHEGNGTPTYYTKVAILLDGGSLSNSTITFNNSSTKTFDKAYKIFVTLLRSNAVVYNCDFKDFTSSVYGNLTIINIWHDSLSNVDNCSFSNMSSVAVGTIGGSAPGQPSGGSVRAITVNFWPTDPYMGSTNISNCSFSNIRSVDSSGTEVKHDCDGIYIAGTANGVIGYYRDVFIQSCVFTNVRRRAIKVQAEGVVIDNCQFNYDMPNQSTLIDSIIGFMSHNLTMRKSTITTLDTSYNIIHLYSGNLVIDNCSVNTLGALLLNSVLSQTVKIDNCNIVCKNRLAYHGADLIGTGTNDIKISNSTLNIGESLRGQDGNICLYNNCIIDTANLKEAYSFAPGSTSYFEGVTVKDSILNFDISDIDTNVALIEFAKELNFNNNRVNINSNQSTPSAGMVFKSSYKVEGLNINIDTVYFTQTHNSSLMMFNGITANATLPCYIKNIDLSTFGSIQSISCNTGSPTTFVTFENIRVDTENNQYLLLYGIKNVIFRNIYSIPNTYSDSGITINYTLPSNIIFERVYLKPSTQSVGQDFLKAIRSIGGEGYILNTIDNVIRRKYIFDSGQEVFLSISNTNISGETPTLQPTDAGVSKYHISNKKYILWNGTNWVNMDGSALA